MSKESRARADKKRMGKQKQFSVWLDKALLADLQKNLEVQKINRTDWLKAKIKEDLGK